MIFLLLIGFVAGRLTGGRLSFLRGSTGCPDRDSACRQSNLGSCYYDKWFRDNCPCLCHDADDSSDDSDDSAGAPWSRSGRDDSSDDDAPWWSRLPNQVVSYLQHDSSEQNGPWAKSNSVRHNSEESHRHHETNHHSEESHHHRSPPSKSSRHHETHWSKSSHRHHDDDSSEESSHRAHRDSRGKRHGDTVIVNVDARVDNTIKKHRHHDDDSSSDENHHGDDLEVHHNGDRHSKSSHRHDDDDSSSDEDSHRGDRRHSHRGDRRHSHRGDRHGELEVNHGDYHHGDLEVNHGDRHGDDLEVNHNGDRQSDDHHGDASFSTHEDKNSQHKNDNKVFAPSQNVNVNRFAPIMVFKQKSDHESDSPAHKLGDHHDDDHFGHHKPGVCQDVGGVDFHPACDPAVVAATSCLEKTQSGLWLREHCPCLCPRPLAAAPAAPETPAPETPAPETPAPETPAPETPAAETPTAEPVMGPLEDGQGCSNAGVLTIDPPGEFAVAKEGGYTECMEECLAMPECETAHYTDGWIAWSCQCHKSGGYDDEVGGVGTPAVQSLLETTCKIASCDLKDSEYCGEETNCSNPGEDQCPDDEECISVGPAAAGCGNTIPAHTASECVHYDLVPNPIEASNGFAENGGAALELNTGTSMLDNGVDFPDCAAEPAGSCYGPYQDSESFHAMVGDVLSWTYQAIGGFDWFEVMVIILRDGHPVAIPTFRFGDKLADPRTDKYTVTQEGEHVIRFVVGSYDFTGGQLLGATMTVHTFERTDANGEGYSMCRLLTDGCEQAAISGASSSQKIHA